MNDIRSRIQDAVAVFSSEPLRRSGSRLLGVLGYASERVPAIDGKSDLLELLASGDLTAKQRELFDDWSDVKSLFQFTEDELPAQDDRRAGAGFQLSRAESFVFLAVELRQGNYARGKLVAMTRAVNRLFAMPVIVVYRYRLASGDLVVTIAVVHRRPNRKDPDRDVLERVTLVKDVRVRFPHRAHLDVLAGLSLDKLTRDHRIRSFDELHEAWEKALDTEPLNRRFYKELFEWFERAVEEADWPCPQSVQPEQQVIRCITRVLFVWFIKEKGLVAEDWFEREEMDELLLEVGGSDYYRAVLQNLFFATLNVPIDK